MTSTQHPKYTLSKQSSLDEFLNENKKFADDLKEQHPDIVAATAKKQTPHTLWVGCSDSRYSEKCLNVLPGEVFTLRNIANVIASHDISSAGAIQFAIEALNVKKIVVCGHTDCGGIWASLGKNKIGGVLDQWLYPVRQLRAQNLEELEKIEDPDLKCRKLSELNVINSVHMLKRHPSAVNALKKGEIEVYGLMYDVSSGLLEEIKIPEDTYHSVFNVEG
ncbi:hypothetical protein PACTADRAFT_43000 [Pachysolen tannophilus NRRL Y-2460]|uniref:Carbonic anhydrase n=1 Tax=Pachysolen tannophilus NRRL Y-2460 TaxID=669874 RepID=A0A1E4TUX8_PACTA|nr:hypothetical protein PACTADRAFT_43000 [Pachysolen tannophilus NRRL Y-2460]